MLKSLILAVLLFVISLGNSARAQNSLESDQPARYFEQGLFHFERGYYGLARYLFGTSRVNAPSSLGAMEAEAAFKEALAASYLENEDARYLLENFIEDYPQSNHISHARFRIGELAQDKGRFPVAVRWYDDVNPNRLEPSVRQRFYFKAGYVNFMEGNTDKAFTLLSRGIDTPSIYWASSNYYYAHILHQRGNHEQALAIFERIINEPGFEKVIPFHLAMIYFAQGEFDKAIEAGTPLMPGATGSMRVGLARVLGGSWFAKGQYNNAVPLLLIAVNDAATRTREDIYNLGMAYYFIGDYSQATNFLAQVTAVNDIMTQNAHYYLADSFIRLGDKKNARIAFEGASRLNFDMAIKEDAMFNFIKLNFELSFSPFNEIINSFLKFIEEFPQSRHIDQAYQYLGQAFLTTRNYQQALEAMEQIRNKNAEVLRAMQRVSYFRGLELFTNLQFNQAISMFDYSLRLSQHDPSIASGALYWRGEARYRTGDFQGALADYRAFLNSPGARNMAEFVTAHYNIAYANFNLGNFAEAGNWFRQFIELSRNRQGHMHGDALNRLGDTYFMTRDFASAVRVYNQAAAIQQGSPDYAIFQGAVAMGLLGDNQGKIRQLNGLIQRFPASNFVDDAWYELGRTHVAINNFNDAIRCFRTVRDNFQRSSFAKKSMVQLGLVYYNMGDLDQSLVAYKRVVNEFPGTQEADAALIGIRNIYMDRNNPDGYIRFTNQVGGFARVDDRQRDSLSFVSAERLYMAGNCDQALVQLDNYLRAFPQGRFAINAHFYKADCQLRSEDLNNALVSLEFIVGRGKSQFSEEALKHVGAIHFRQSNYSRALEAFKRLEEEAEVEENRQEALIGQLRAHARLKDHGATTIVAGRVIENPRMAPEIVREARYLKGLAHLELGQQTAALGEFRILADNTRSREGAEAKFRVAELLFQAGNHAEAEAQVFDFVNKGTPHQYWLARGFILLSDIYALKGQNFQAIQYLESLLENYKGQDDDIHEMARDRMSKLAN